MTENEHIQPLNHLSDEMRKILEDESKEAEIQGAIDAAGEEGISIDREEAVRILAEKQENIPPEKV